MDYITNHTQSKRLESKEVTVHTFLRKHSKGSEQHHSFDHMVSNLAQCFGTDQDIHREDGDDSGRSGSALCRHQLVLTVNTSRI